MNFFVKTKRLINFKEKILILILTLLIIISMLLEVISIGAIIPLISSLLEHNKFSENFYFLNNFRFFELLKNLNIFFILTGFAIIIVFKNIFVYLTNVFNSFVLNNITRRLSKNLFKKFSNLTYEEFTERKVAGMININTNVVNTFKESLANTIILFTEITVFLGIIIFLLSLEPLSVLIINSVALTICYLFYKLNKNILTRWGNFINKNKEGKLQIIYQSFNLIKNIKISKKLSYFFNNFEFFNRKEYKYIFLSSCISMLPRFLFEIAGVLLITFSIFMMTKMSINKDEIIIIVSILGLASLRILPAVARITNSISLIGFHKYSIDIIHSELDNKKINKESAFNETKILNFEKLELNQVSFSREKNPILKEINFKLIKGDSIGIRGISGSGKTTFVDIICGLLKPSRGKIILNDHIDVSKYQNTIPIKIGYIPQDVFLSNNSLEENIAFGICRDKIDNDKIIKLMELCELSKFIDGNKVRSGVNLGDGGSNLSGGEKQRIGIARALYDDPELLIFDEFTSSLDSYTEQEILKNLQKIIENKTTIFISHNNSTLLNCKKIYEFQNHQITKFQN
jgi:ATP-binding cassette, subfamily B, bacterial PglK